MRYKNLRYPGARMVIDGDVEVSGSIFSQQLIEATGRAQNAVAQARNLQQAAEVSFASIADAASDSVIVPLEKLMLKREVANVSSEYPVIILQASEAGVLATDPEYIEYVYRYNRLREYLYGDIYTATNPAENVTNPVLDPEHLGDNFLSENCGEELRQRFQDYIDARETLKQAASRTVKQDLAAEISSRAKFFYGDDIPIGPYSVGDVWVVDAALYMSTTARGEGESSSSDWEWYIRPNITLVVESTNGDVFKPGQTMSTQLIARAFKNGLEITGEIPASLFRWRRVSFYPQASPLDDATWNSNHAAGYKTIDVTAQDIYARATYFCDILA